MRLQGDRNITELDEDGQKIVYVHIRIPVSPMSKLAIEYQFDSAKADVIQLIEKETNGRP